MLRVVREFLLLLPAKATINKPSQRIKKTKEFTRLRSASLKLNTTHFLVLAEPAAGETSRLGVTVSTKIDKRAVVRNRIKRIIREAFRAFHKKLLQHFDIVVIARKNASLCSSKEVEQELLRVLVQKGLISR